MAKKQRTRFWCLGVFAALLAGGWFLLPPFEHEAEYSTAPVPEGISAWAYTTAIGPGGRKEFGVLADNTSTVIPGAGLSLSPPWGLFSRHLRTRIQPLLLGGTEDGKIPVRPSSDYVLKLEFIGSRSGDMTWWLTTYDATQMTLEDNRLTSVILGDYQSPEFAVRFLTDSKTNWIKPRFSFNGPFELNLAAVRFYQNIGTRQVLFNPAN